MQPVLFPRLVGEITCPAQAIKNYLNVRVATAFDAPFFVDRRGTPLSRGRFNDKLKILMHLVESELIGRFSSKSFRIGATSDSYCKKSENSVHPTKDRTHDLQTQKYYGQPLDHSYVAISGD